MKLLLDYGADMHEAFSDVGRFNGFLENSNPECIDFVMRSGKWDYQLSRINPRRCPIENLRVLVRYGYWHKDMNDDNAYVSQRYLNAVYRMSGRKLEYTQYPYGIEYEFIGDLNERHEEYLNGDSINEDFERVIRHRIWTYETLRDMKDKNIGDIFFEFINQS